MDSELLVFALGLLLFQLAYLFLTSYSIRHFRKRAPELGITSKMAQRGLSETTLPAGILGADAGRVLVERYPFATALLYFGIAVLLLIIQLPFASAGVALLSVLIVAN